MYGGFTRYREQRRGGKSGHTVPVGHVSSQHDRSVLSEEERGLTLSYPLLTAKLLRQSGFCMALISVAGILGATHAEPIALATPKTALTGAS